MNNMQNTNHDKNNSNDKIYVYNTDKMMVYKGKHITKLPE